MVALSGEFAEYYFSPTFAVLSLHSAYCPYMPCGGVQFTDCF